MPLFFVEFMEDVANRNEPRNDNPTLVEAENIEEIFEELESVYPKNIFDFKRLKTMLVITSKTKYNDGRPTFSGTLFVEEVKAIPVKRMKTQDFFS